MNNITFVNDLVQKEAFNFKSELIDQVEKNQETVVDVSQCKNADLVGVNALAMSYLKAQELNHTIIFRIKKESELFKLLKLTKFSKILPLVFS